MTAGVVYVMTNPAMPGIVKVGRSTLGAELRARHLSMAGNLPAPYEPHSEREFRNTALVEAFVHHVLRPRVYAKSREFFSVRPAEAAAIIDSVDESRIDCRVFKCSSLMEGWRDPKVTAPRLREARIAAGFENMNAAARHFGWVRYSYYTHETGMSGLSLVTASRYGEAFGVSPAWLLFGDEPAPAQEGEAA